MKNYSFKDYLVFRESFETTDNRDSNMQSLVGRSNRIHQVEFAVDIAKDVFSLNRDENIQPAKEVINALEAYLKNPNQDTAIACQNAADNLIEGGTPQQIEAMQATYLAGNTPLYGATEANSAADHAARAHAHTGRNNTYGERRMLYDAYNKHLNKYQSWANAYHTTPKEGHINKQEIAKMLNDEHDIKYVLDFLEEHDMRPSENTLRKFGVKNLLNNETIAEDMLKAHTVSGFYKAIRRSLGL